MFIKERKRLNRKVENCHRKCLVFENQNFFRLHSKKKKILSTKTTRFLGNRFRSSVYKRRYKGHL